MTQLILDPCCGTRMMWFDKQNPLVAVAQHVLRFGEPVEITRVDGTPEYRITVEALNQQTKGN